MKKDSKSIGVNIKNFPNEELKENSTYISSKKEKRIKYKGIQIPKLLLNKNIFDLNNDKRFYYSHRKKNKLSSENYVFLKRPRKDELTNYYFSKNKSIINDISLNSKRKINNISTLERLTQSEIKKTKVKKKPIKYRIFQMNQNNYNKRNESEKNNNSMNTSFLSSKADDPFLDIKILNYLKEREKEKNKLLLLVNNPFVKKSNGKNRLYPLFNRRIIIERLLKPKKIKNEIYETIFQEYKNAQLKLSNNNEILERKLLRNEIYRNKDKKNIFTKKFINNSGETQRHLLDDQVNLIKRKIDSNYINGKNLEYSNNYETNLFLSLSNTKDQIYNIRAIPKLINDSSVIKDFVEEVFISTNKK